MSDLVATAIELLKDNQDLAKTGLAVLGASGAVSIFFWKRISESAKFLKDRYINRLQICVISETTAPRFDDFIELYHEIFGSDERVSTKEIQDWLSWKADHEGIQYRLYLGMHGSRSTSVAISFFQYSTKILFIPYMGVSDLDIHWAPTRIVLRALMRAVSREARNWRLGFVEIADPAEPKLAVEEVRRRHARIKRLKALAAREGLEMLNIDVKYVQPSFANDVDQQELCEMLLFVLLRERQKTSLPRELVMDGLDFIYNRIYRASFVGSPDDASAYQIDLKSRLAAFEAQLGDIVALRN